MLRRGHGYYWKRVLIALGYVLLYLVLSYSMFPPTTYVLLRQEDNLGDHYALLYLVSANLSVFSDREGSHVFTSRGCGNCFITNNKGFAPLWEYDAVVMDEGEGYRSVLADKRFRLHATAECVRGKLVNCDVEPHVTSEETKETFDLCGLCGLLLKRRDEDRIS